MRYYNNNKVSKLPVIVFAQIKFNELTDVPLIVNTLPDEQVIVDTTWPSIIQQYDIDKNSNHIRIKINFT